MEAVILAAGLSSRLWPITINRPKCLLEVGGTTLLERQISQLRQNNIEKISIVVGHGADSIISSVSYCNDLSFIYNHEYKTSNSSISLFKALGQVREPLIFLMSDYYYADGFLERVVKCDEHFVIAVDRLVKPHKDSVRVLLRKGNVIRIGKNINNNPYGGCFAGVVKAGNTVTDILYKQIEKLVSIGERSLYVVDVLDNIIRANLANAHAVNMSGLFWDEIDTCDDLERVRLSVALQASGSPTNRPDQATLDSWWFKGGIYDNG